MDEAEIPEIQGALVFTNEQAEVDGADAPIPAMKAKQLKDFMMQRAKERPLGSLQLQRITSVLPDVES